MNPIKRLLSKTLSARQYARLSRANQCLNTALKYRWTYIRSKYFTARKVYSLGPVETDQEGTVEIHTVTGRRHLTMAMWAWISWYAQTGRRDPLCIHDDGSLKPWDCERVRRVFPRCRFILKEEADQKMDGVLRDYPLCADFRRRIWPNAAQLLDYARFCESDRLLSFDSDLLFFRRPEELIQAIEQNGLEGKIRSRFAVGRTGGTGLPAPQELLEERTGIRPHREFNNGFGLVATQSMDLDRIEKILRDLHDLILSRPWWTQTMMALLSEAWGVDYFSAAYHVGGRGPGPEELVQKHYTLPIRELFWAEGLPAVMPSVKELDREIREIREKRQTDKNERKQIKENE